MRTASRDDERIFDCDKRTRAFSVQPHPATGGATSEHVLQKRTAGSRELPPEHPDIAPEQQGRNRLASIRAAMARGRLERSCSGRVIRSQYRDTGRKQSFAVMVGSPAFSICCKTGSGRRLAKTSPGSRRTGSRLTCASAAAVTIFVAPGPMEVVQAIIWRRFFGFGKGDGRVRHGLFVMGAVCWQDLPRLIQSFAEARHIAVTEYPPDAREQRMSAPSISGFLRGEVVSPAPCAIVRRMVLWGSVCIEPSRAHRARMKPAARSCRPCVVWRLCRRSRPATRSSAGLPKIVRPMAKPLQMGCSAAQGNRPLQLFLGRIEAEDQHTAAMWIILIDDSGNMSPCLFISGRFQLPPVGINANVIEIRHGFRNRLRRAGTGLAGNDFKQQFVMCHARQASCKRTTCSFCF